MKLSTHPKSTVAHMIYNILPCGNKNSSRGTRLSIKKLFSNLRHGKMPIFTVLSFHTQICWKLENILNKLLKKRTLHALHQIDVSTSDHWRILQHTFQCMAGAMKSLRKGNVTCRMLSKNEMAFWFVLKKKKKLDVFQNIRYYNNVKQLGKYS